VGTESVGVMGSQFGWIGDSGGGIMRGVGETGVRGQLRLKSTETIYGSPPNAARVWPTGASIMPMKWPIMAA
jgi:hypothetical protein